MFACGPVVILMTTLFIGCCTCSQVQESAFGGFESATANAHSGHRVAGAGVLGRDDPASIHDGFEGGLAEALADQLGLDLTVGEVPVTDIVVGWLRGADMAQVSATKERATSPTALIVAAREGLSVLARFDHVESIVGPP